MRKVKSYVMHSGAAVTVIGLFECIWRVVSPPFLGEQVVMTGLVVFGVGIILLLNHKDIP